MDTRCEIFVIGPLSGAQETAPRANLVEISGRKFAVSTRSIVPKNPTSDLRSYRVYLANDFERENHFGKIAESRFDPASNAFVARYEESIFNAGLVAGVGIEEVAVDYLRAYIEEQQASAPDDASTEVDGDDTVALRLIAALVLSRKIELRNDSDRATVSASVADLLAEAGDEQSVSGQIYELLLEHKGVSEVYCAAEELEAELLAVREAKPRF